MFFIIFDNLFVSFLLPYFLLCNQIGEQYAKNTVSTFSGYPFYFSCLEKERTQITEKVSQPTSTAEVPIAGAEEIHMKKEEYDAVVGKLQEMKS